MREIWFERACQLSVGIVAIRVIVAIADVNIAVTANKRIEKYREEDVAFERNK
jgi:hypothetical protein